MENINLDQQTQKIRVLVIGDDKTGKKQIANSMGDKCFSEISNDKVFLQLNKCNYIYFNQNFNLSIFSLQKNQIAESLKPFLNFNVILIIFDIKRKETIDSAKILLEKLLDENFENILIVANKCDETLEFQDYDPIFRINQKNFEVISVSSKTKENMKILIEKIIKISIEKLTVNDVKFKKANLENANFNVDNLCFRNYLIDILPDKEIQWMEENTVLIIDNTNKKIDNLNNFDEYQSTIKNMQLLMSKYITYLQIVSKYSKANEKAFDFLYQINYFLERNFFNIQCQFLRNILFLDIIDPNHKIYLQKQFLFGKEKLSLENFQEKVLIISSYFKINKYIFNKCYTEYLEKLSDVISEIRNKFIISLDQQEDELKVCTLKARYQFAKANIYINDSESHNSLKKTKIMKMNGIEKKQRYVYHLNQSLLFYKKSLILSDRRQYELNLQILNRAEVAKVLFYQGEILKANIYILSAYLIFFSNFDKFLISQQDMILIDEILRMINSGELNKEKELYEDFQLEDKIIIEKKLTKELIFCLPPGITSWEIAVSMKEESQSSLLISTIKNKIEMTINCFICNHESGFLFTNKNDFYDFVAKPERSIRNYLYAFVFPGLLAYCIIKIYDYIDSLNKNSLINTKVKRINQILNESLQLYINHEFNSSILKLQEEFYPQEKIINEINENLPKNIFECLMKYHYDSWQITYVLDMVGKCLLKLNFNENKGIAKLAFIQILDDSLIEKSINEDSRIQEHIVDDKYISKLNVNRKSLEETRNMARLNLGFLEIMENKERTKDYIFDFELSLKKFELLRSDEQCFLKDLYGLIYSCEIKLNCEINISHIIYTMINDKKYFCDQVEINQKDLFESFNFLTNNQVNLSKEKLLVDLDKFYGYHSIDISNILIQEEVRSIQELFQKDYFDIFSINFLKLLSVIYKIDILFFNVNMNGKEDVFEFNKYHSIVMKNSKSKLHLVTNEGRIIKGLKPMVQMNIISIDEEEETMGKLLKNEDKINSYLSIVEKITLEANSIKDIDSKNYYVLLKESLKYLDKCLEIDPLNSMVSLIKSETMINLGLFEEAKHEIENLNFLRNQSDYWVNLSKISRKLYSEESLQKSKLYLEEAEKINNNNEKVLIEREIHNQIENHWNYLNPNSSPDPEGNEQINKNLKKLYSSYEYNESLSTFRPRKDLYKILSLDGGGIRGIIESVILSEIEFRVKKPIKELFNMLAGTSTGGIVSAGLTIPHPDFANKPKFQARDLTNLYIEDASSIFGNPRGLTERVFQSKYSAEGRLKVLQKFFGDTTIDRSLNDLVITSVDENDQIYLFNRHDALLGNKYYYTDVLMSTSAAPTFFPAHKIGEKTFLDGGVQVNNPTIEAITEAVRYGNKLENIFCLSLGTGYYKAPTLKIDKHEEGFLFWAPKISDFLGGNQENYVSSKSSLLLKDRYFRLQSTIFEDIELDDFIAIPTLLNYANDYVVEIYSTGKLNKLLNMLEVQSEI